MMTASNIHYEYADRTRGLGAGGIGALFLLAQRIELVKDIDRDLHLLKRHLPYHESDHVLNIALNLLAGGRRIEHLELRRTDEVYLDALGARRIPRVYASAWDVWALSAGAGRSSRPVGLAGDRLLLLPSNARITRHLQGRPHHGLLPRLDLHLTDS